MAKIQINEFKGIMPKVANDKLPPNMAQTALDLKTATGELKAYRKSTASTALTGSAYKSLFEYLEGGNNHWVYYNNIVHWVRSPVANDTWERMYFTGMPAQKSKGTVTFTDGMTDGETLTIGSETFEFDIGDDGVGGGNTELGTAATTTKELCAAALAAKTPAAAVTFTDNLDGTVTVEATTAGVAGNTIAFSNSGAHIDTDTYNATAFLGGTFVGTAANEYAAFVNDLQGAGTFDFTTDFYYPGAPSGSAPTVSPQVAGALYIAYFYTYVSRYGEEGPPSSLGESSTNTLNGRNDIDDIDYPDAADEHLITKVGTNRPYVKLYRTADDGAGNADFLHVLNAYWFDSTETYVAGEYVFYGGAGTYDLYECTVGGTGTWAGGTHTFVQGESVDVADLGSVGDSPFDDRAPDGLTGLRGHPNGFFVAHKDNVLYFSEPFAPWAWPEDYQIPIDHDIKSIGIFGSTIVVATDGWCYTFTGPHPTSLYKNKLSFQPCLSQQALVETDDGVMFPSPEGFQHVTAAGMQNVTAPFFQPEDWDDYELETMQAAWYNKAYYGFYKSADYDGNVVIDFLNGAVTSGVNYHLASYVSIANGEFYTIFQSDIDEPSIYYISQWDSDTSSYRNFMYKSPRYILEKPKNFKVAQVILDTDFYNDVLDIIADGGTLSTLNNAAWSANPATSWGQEDLFGPLNGSMLNEQDVNGDNLYSLSSLGVQSYVEFKVYANGVLKFTKQVSNSNMFKLPRGFKDKKWEIEVSGMIPIKRITMATSTEEIV